MDIDITDFFTNADAYEFSGSQAERGKNAGKETWANAMSEATREPLLTTPEQLDALRDEMRSTGAWEDEEIDAWTPQKCNALFIQYVSGDLRQVGADNTFPDEFDWEAYEKKFDGGLRFYRGDNGRVYFFLGD